MGQAGLLGDILELASAQVAEQDVTAAGGGDEQVESAIVIVVGPGGGHADAVAQADAGPVGDVLEGAIALVAEKLVGAQLIEKINVVVAVAVEVADGHAAAVVVQVRLEVLPLFAGQEVHAEV